jgi:hypothetical protein
VTWLNSLFTGDAPSTPSTPAPSAPVITFSDRVTASLDSLAQASRRSGAAVSPAAFSQLRSIDDVIRPLLAHIALHPVMLEREIALEALVTDYVPTTLTLFMQLPESQQADGGKADLLLQAQFTALERSARQQSTTIFEDSVSALETHAIFIQNKFQE